MSSNALVDSLKKSLVSTEKKHALFTKRLADCDEETTMNQLVLADAKEKVSDPLILALCEEGAASNERQQKIKRAKLVVNVETTASELSALRTELAKYPTELCPRGRLILPLHKILPHV
jgi:hypothetical protein